MSFDLILLSILILVKLFIGLLLSFSFISYFNKLNGNEIIYIDFINVYACVCVVVHM